MLDGRIERTSGGASKQVGKHRPRAYSLAALITFLTLLGVALTGGPASAAANGSAWALRTSVNTTGLATENNWRGIAYGNGVFVAVATNGVGSRVMYSSDGITWTQAPSTGTQSYRGIAFGNGTFVAVATSGGTANHVMTSTDGKSWTARPTADVALTSVAYGNGLFVAAAQSGTGTRVITSSDGITWTTRSTPTPSADLAWTSITFGNGTFVAVADNTQQATAGVMTSTNGTSWTVATITQTGTLWTGVTYGNGTYVAVATNAVMTSTDGATWTSRTPAANRAWKAVTYGNGTFVAVASSGTNDRAMTSTDGITWATANTTNANQSWQAVTYGNGVFVAVAQESGSLGTLNRVMTSNDLLLTQSGNTLKVVPASNSIATSTNPTIYRILYNTSARVTAGLNWGIWGFNWAGAPTKQGLTAGNTFDVNLANYANAGSCSTVETTTGFMPAADCPRALGVLGSGQSMPFKAQVKIGSTWSETPVTTISRP